MAIFCHIGLFQPLPCYSILRCSLWYCSSLFWCHLPLFCSFPLFLFPSLINSTSFHSVIFCFYFSLFPLVLSSVHSSLSFLIVRSMYSTFALSLISLGRLLSLRVNPKHTSFYSSLSDFELQRFSCNSAHMFHAIYIRHNTKHFSLNTLEMFAFQDFFQGTVASPCTSLSFFKS